MKFARFLAVLPLLSGPVFADELRVAVASNFTPVLEQLAPLFEQQSDHSLALISGATGNHYAQILNGAPFDVFLAADDERPRLLEEQGNAVKGTSFTYALGRLVLWSADSARVDSEGAVLKNEEFAHLALANPKLAPYGEAAQQALMQLGLWERLQARIVQGDNIAQTLQFVQTGNAELGFIARAQLADIDGGSHWHVPAELHDAIVQQGVLLVDTAAGRAFIDFLQGAQGRAVIEAAGYELP